MNMSSALRLIPSGLLVGAEAARFGVDRLIPTRRGLPDRGDAVSPRWLEQILGVSAGCIRGVCAIEEHQGTAFRARVAIDSGCRDVPSSVFLKLPPRTLGGRVFMNAMGLGEREVRFYRDVAPDLPVRVPRCFGAVVDSRRGRNVIVLEDLSGRATFRDITQPCTVEEATAVVGALADLHAPLWSSPRFIGDLAAFVPRYDTPSARLGGALVRRIIEQPRGMVAATVPVDVQRSSRVLVEHGSGIAAFGSSEPRTFTHNDTHLGNLFFEDGVPGFLDWQNASVGTGIGDVAYFVLPSLEPGLAREAEHELVRGYAERLTSHGIVVDASHLWERYRAAAAQYFIGAVVAGAFGGRLQREHIARTGIERAVAAVRALGSFELLRDSTGGERP